MRGRGHERRARQRAALDGEELAPPTVRARRVADRPTSSDVPRDDQVGAHQAAAGRGEASQQRRRHREGRVGDDVERTPREAKVSGVGDDDRHAPGIELLAQRCRAPLVQLDREHACTALDKLVGDRSSACADVDDEVARSDLCIRDECRGPRVSELVPSPAPRWRGHGGPSRSSPCSNRSPSQDGFRGAGGGWWTPRSRDDDP